MSTDSDPPTDDEQVRELVRDELAKALAEADIDLGDLPQEKGTTRREVLKAAGLAGAAGLTGAGGMSAATEPASAGTQSTGTVGSAANPVDIEAEDINAAAIDADKINNVWTAPTPSDSTDIGAEINSIHDNDAADGDAIFVPPGVYTNQQTKILLTRDIAVFSVGNWRRPGAEIRKQSDIIACEIDDSETGNEDSVQRPSLAGIAFDGADVADTNVGILADGFAYLDAQTRSHGSHGLYLESDDGNSNGARVKVDSRKNSGDGVRVENLTGGINMNAMDLSVISLSNSGTGYYQRDAYSNRIWLWSQGDNKPYDIVDNVNANELTVYTENSTNAGTYPATDPYSKVHVLNNANNMTLPVQTWDRATEVAKSDGPGDGMQSATGTDGRDAIVSYQNVYDVSTTASPIANISSSGHVLFVTGMLSGDNTIEFVDRVTAFSSGSVTDSTELGTRGLPAARTYSVNGTDLEMSMGSGTYLVAVDGRGLTTFGPNFA